MVRDDLIFMSKEQLKGSFLHKRVRVVLTDGKEEVFIIKELQLASYSNNESYSVVGFISQSGKSFSFQGIEEIFILTM